MPKLFAKVRFTARKDQSVRRKYVYRPQKFWSMSRSPLGFAPYGKLIQNTDVGALGAEIQ